MAQIEQESPNSFGRRVFLSRAAQLFAAGTEATVLVGQSPRVREHLPPSHATIKFELNQEQKLQHSTSLCLMFGGATIRSMKPTADVLTPVLEQLGPVGYIEYAKHGLDVASIATHIRKLQKEHPDIKNLSIYAHSLGAQVAGELMELLGDEMTLRHVFLDCVAPSLDYVDHPNVARGFQYASDVTGEISTVALNMFVHRRPHKWDLAPTGLLRDQVDRLHHGERYIASLASKAARDKTYVVLLTPLDPQKDPVVDAENSEKRLKELFLNLEVARIEGKNQGHANPPDNPVAYRSAIAHSIRQHKLM